MWQSRQLKPGLLVQRLIDDSPVIMQRPSGKDGDEATIDAADMHVAQYKAVV